jgi:hypothetical protein
VAVDRLALPRDLTGYAAGALLLAFALLAGVAVGNQDLGLGILLGVLLGAVLVTAACFWPHVSMWILLANTMTLPVLPITASRGVNLIDAFLFPTLIGAYFAHRGQPVGAMTGDVPQARRRLVRALLAYLGAAVLSLLVLAMRGYPAHAGDSSLLLFRFVQGVLFFIIVERLVRTRQDLYRARGAIAIGFLIGAAVNVYGFLVFAVPRAGTTWNILVGDHFIGSPNEAGFAITLLWALMLALPMRRALMMPLLLVSIAFLVATASRSGLLAWFTFVAVWAIVSRKGWLLLLPLTLGLIYPFLPESLTGRLMRTILLQRGSFEAYSTLVRVYAWHTAFNVFRHFPILGVGYLCFRFFSYQYNGLTLNLGTAENMILETATGMGLVGLIAMFWLAASVYRLARSVMRSTTKGSPAWNLARMSTPMLIANVVANLTADNLTGMVSAAQMATWCAFLIAASRIDHEARAREADAAAVRVAA